MEGPPELASSGDSDTKDPSDKQDEKGNFHNS